MRRLLLLAALSMVATLAFASVAQAQYTLEGTDAEDCSDVEEQLDSPAGALFVPDVDGCILYSGVEIEPTLDVLNRSAYDPDTGEELGLVKDLDPDLSGGANRITYQEFCEAFPTTPEADSPLAGLTAQEYFEETANAEEQAILDLNGDGLACTDEDEAFLAGGTGAGEPGGGSQDQYDDETDGGGNDDGGQQSELLPELPDTGGPALFLPIAGLLAGSGILGLLVAIRRRA